MLKKILVILAMLYAAASFAAVDVNKATAAELDGIKGIGPVMSKRIIDERKKGDFKNWDDLMARVKGIAPLTAARYSAGGLTVKGEEFKRMEPTKEDVKAAREKEAKAQAKADKKETKADVKAEKKEEKKEAKAEAKAEKKDEKAAATSGKKDEKAAAAKPAASAKK